MPNSQFFRRLRRAAPAASSLQRPARLRRPTAAGKASTAAPAVGCRAPMHGVWYSTEYGDGVWSTDRRGSRRKIFLACGAQMFRRLAAKTAFAWGRRAKKATFALGEFIEPNGDQARVVQARWNMYGLPTMEYGVLEYASSAAPEELESIWRMAGRRPAGGRGVWSTGLGS